MKTKEKSSETIPKGSRDLFPEKVALFKFYVLKDPRDGLIKYVGRTVDEKTGLEIIFTRLKKEIEIKKKDGLLLC